MKTFLCRLPVPNQSATPLANTLMTQTFSMALDQLVPWSHHPSRILMKTWVPPTPTMVPYLLLVTLNPNSLALPSISLIGVAAFKQLIDAGEEVYTINIQLTVKRGFSDLTKEPEV